jgi:hypothetical protein
MNLRSKIIIGIAAICIAILSAYAYAMKHTSIAPISVWQWNSVAELSPADAAAMAETLKKEGMQTVFVRVDDYVDIREGSNKESLDSFEAGLARFITLAHEKGIEVDALGGGTDWARDSHSYIPPLLIDFVGDFNKAHPKSAFDALQFDVEPYSSEEYAGNEAAMMAEYFAFVENSIAEADRNGKIPLGFTIPPWYDGSRGDPVSIAAESGRKPLAYAMLDALERYGRGYLVVMAYRTKADNAIAAAKNTLDYAAANSPHVKIWIGQEMGKVGEEGVSFYGSMPDAFQAQSKLIDDAYEGNPAYAGRSIDDYDSYGAFLEKR